MSELIRQRLRLYGRPATKEDIAKEVSRLYLGDKTKRQEPCSPTQIKETLGFNSRQTVYTYLEMACELGHLQKDETGKFIQPKISSSAEFKDFCKEHPFTQHPLIAEWIKDLQTRKSGKEVKTWRSRLSRFEAICNTLRVNPERFLIGLTESEELVKNFLVAYKEGSVKGHWKSPDAVDMANIQYTYAQAVRDFMRTVGKLQYPKGTTGVMAQIPPNHGKYSDVRLTEEEMEQADKYLIENYGLDSDEYRWFWIGVESCARDGALKKMRNDYVKHTSREGKTIYIMTAFESKTEHIKGGKWTKYITRPQTQKSIDLLRARGGGMIYENKDNLSAIRFGIKMREEMKKLYTYLGKAEVHNGYFMSHATHVLRHVGAHYWLAKTKYNYGVVAMVGGWNTPNELKKSYGEMPHEVVLEMIESVATGALMAA